MKLFVGILMIVSISVAQLISKDELQNLFEKALRNEMSRDERGTLQNVFELLHRPEFISLRSLENSSKIRTTLDCLVCRSAFSALFKNVLNGQTNEEISETISDFCAALGYESDNVCRGFISLNLPIITHIIRTVPEATPTAFCGLVFQKSDDINNCRFEDPRFDWQVDLPEPAFDMKEVPKASATPLKVVILTDAHIDPLYEAYGVANCDAPTCCRKGQKEAQNFVYKAEEIVDETVVKHRNSEPHLDLSILPKIRQNRSLSRTWYPRNSSPAGFWGDYRNCDTPVWAFDDVVETIAENHDNIDIIYYIGDTIDHGVWETTNDLVVDMNKYLVDKIRNSFGDDVLVLPVIGNHDAQPANQFASSSVSGTNLNTTWLYEALTEKWSFYLTEEAKDSFREIGGFSMVVRPGLKVISINNNVSYKNNWWLVHDPLDAKLHLDFLVQELYDAESNGQKVHILIHIPTGTSDLTYTWTREYNRIVNRFTSTIAAEFNGHMHTDEFKIFYNDQGSPINVAWNGGGATTYSNYNLNYKIAIFDGDTYEPEKIVSYSYNLTEANLTPDQRPQWSEMYDMQTTFQIQDLSATSMDKLVYDMVTDKKELFNLYSEFNSKKSDIHYLTCDEECKINNLCRNVVTVLWEREKCNEIKKLFYSN